LLSVLKYGTTGYLPEHQDQGVSSRVLSTVAYLNDDYVGGEIYFPNQGFIYKPRKFSAVFFPSAGTEYIHGINMVESGHRYTALYMHTSQKQFADKDFLK
jgi:hypothetical protein